jgi:hypothetical protein
VRRESLVLDKRYAAQVAFAFFPDRSLTSGLVSFGREGVETWRFLMLYTKTLSWRNGGHDCFLFLFLALLLLSSDLLCSAVVVSLLPHLSYPSINSFFFLLYPPISTRIFLLLLTYDLESKQSCSRQSL